MRITQSMYYKNLYAQNNSQINSKLFDVNKQIASGLKIQYASDDVLTFSDTMRLDNEITTLGQIRKSTESGYKMSTQTDSILNDFTQTISRTKTLLIQAANDTQSITSRNAIAAELRGLESHFKNLANTSINGQFIFSGSAVDTKPIAEDGTYMGNAQSMNSFLGYGIEQTYNLSGAELFLGEESLVKRKVTTNVPQYSMTAKYPDFTDLTIDGEDVHISKESTIRDLMGDTDNDTTNSYPSHFYISGVRSNGDAFNEHVKMDSDETVEDLLARIGDAFGNTPSVDLVNVELGKNGQIVIEDKITGSSKLSFHMVGAVDFNKEDGTDAADIFGGAYSTNNYGSIDNLNNGETNFDEIIKGRSTVPNPDLYVKNFNRSNYTPTVTPDPQLTSAVYTMSPAPSGTDDLQIDIKTDNGGIVTYTQTYDGVSALSTYQSLAAKIEADGMFDVSVSANTITLDTTAKGIASRVSVVSPLSNSNPLISISASQSTATPTSEISELLYDRTSFIKDGAFLSSTTAQVLKTSNAFASDSTKISEVADISKGTVSTTDDTLHGTKFNLSGTSTGGATYTAEINFQNAASGGSTFSLDTTGNGKVDSTYDIYDLATPRAAVDADDMTYRQLMDVVNMLTTNTLPFSTSVKTAVEIAGSNAADMDFTVDGVTYNVATLDTNTPIKTPEENAEIYATAISNKNIPGISAAFSGAEYTIINTNSTAVALNVVTEGATGMSLGTQADIAIVASDYDKAVEASQVKAQTTLSYDGKVEFKERNTTNTKADISLYDANSGQFDTVHNPSVMTFNSNNALTISDPKTDFFKRLDEIITAVEQNKMHPDATNGDPRSIGMSNAITMIDDLAEHVTRSQSQVGANSNSLTSSIERTTLLEVSTKVLRSSVVEVDLAEASLQLTQLSLNYEAMLATVGKVSKLSLVNYL